MQVKEIKWPLTGFGKVFKQLIDSEEFLLICIDLFRVCLIDLCQVGIGPFAVKVYLLKTYSKLQSTQVAGNTNDLPGKLRGFGVEEFEKLVGLEEGSVVAR